MNNNLYAVAAHNRLEELVRELWAGGAHGADVTIALAMLLAGAMRNLEMTPTQVRAHLEVLEFQALHTELDTTAPVMQ